MKALFFDIDGTLIDNETKQVPRSALKAIKEAREAGHLTFINTGRVECIIGNIKSRFKMDGYICGCGTQIVVGDKTVFEKRIDHDRGIEIKKLLKKFNVEGMLEARQEIYFPAKPFIYPEITERALDAISTVVEPSVGEFDRDDYDFDKFCIFDDPRFSRSDLKSFFAECSDFDIIDRGAGFYECVPYPCSKGKGVLKVLDYYGIALEDAYVFGDSMNDLPMFTCGAKNRIVLGEHDTALEEYSTYFAKKVSEDGIYLSMKELGLI